ncbi:peptidase M28 [Thiocystis violacea]|nr:peptidase M28 [Thiocystis violacea]
MPGHSPASDPLIHHRLEVQIDPETGVLKVQDQMRLPEGKSEWTLLLHGGMNPEIIAGDARLKKIGDLGHLTRYQLRTDATAGSLTLAYQGRIRHDLERIDESLGRARQWSLGTIAPDGVFLDGNSGWYPRLPGTLQAFDLDIQLPKGWAAISQGAGSTDPDGGRAHWAESHPQDDIYLIAGAFRIYRKTSDGFEAQVYLREPDAELAERYLEATLKYLGFYSDLIGPYPFAKFALIENFWESGYGMPSFTLLGSSVIRMPFILQTSYPHEILHNWWGNGVYVDYDSGNWSEGLTYYLADYWLMEQDGRGTEGRRDMLKTYADHVRQDKDFPLVDFTQRHGSDSQAIGYGKAAMFFHMLRRELGDDAFRQGLRRFHADNRFRSAGYADLRHAFEATSGRDLSRLFEAWTQRTGAPRLSLEAVQLTPSGDGVKVTGRIGQTQSDPSFPLRIPVAVDLVSGGSRVILVESDARETPFDLDLDSPPSRLRVDPEFDLFRELAPGETPVALGNLFGSDQGLILLPSEAPAALGPGYRQLAERWRQGHPNWRIHDDAEFSELPTDRPVWLLGWENRHLDGFARDATDFALDASAHRLTLAGIELDPARESPVLTRWRDRQPLAWMATTDPQALPALARKLPHYGKYSYLVFSGPEATNRLKGPWPSGDSNLVHAFE